MANLSFIHSPTNFGAQIDERGGIIYGVSCIATGEAKGHGLFADKKSLETCLAATNSHASGVICKADHGTGVFEAIGTLKNFRIDGDKLRGDLHLLQSHPRRASILELARTAPAAVGLSISFSYAPEIISEQVFIRVKSLYSIDLVDNPALNPTGMFSTPPMNDAELEKLSVHVFGADKVESWKRNGGKFRDVAEGNFYFNNLTATGLDLRRTAQRCGPAKPPFGLVRLQQSTLQEKVNKFTATK